MAKEDCYVTLGVAKNVTTDDLKRAYRKLAMQFHPDRNPGDKQAETRFKEVSEAYDILKDDQKRSAYDRFGHAAFETTQDNSSDNNAADIATQNMSASFAYAYLDNHRPEQIATSNQINQIYRLIPDAFIEKMTPYYMMLLASRDPQHVEVAQVWLKNFLVKEPGLAEPYIKVLSDGQASLYFYKELYNSQPSPDIRSAYIKKVTPFHMRLLDSGDTEIEKKAESWLKDFLKTDSDIAPYILAHLTERQVGKYFANTLCNLQPQAFIKKMKPFYTEQARSTNNNAALIAREWLDKMSALQSRVASDRPSSGGFFGGLKSLIGIKP